MARKMSARWIARLALWSALLPLQTAAAAEPCAPPERLRFAVERRIERSEVGFTQGLERFQGRLFESTGRVGADSKLNVIDDTGRVTTLATLSPPLFGEGLTILHGRVFQLTWQDRRVFVYDTSGKLLRTMQNPRDGWGLANDGQSLIFTDGGAQLHFADPETFAIRKSVPIRMHGAGPVEGVNELELVSGKLFGNVFLTAVILRIDPGGGCVEAVADMRPLWLEMTQAQRAQVASSPENVLNGIAHDAQTGLFYVTGKRWSAIFVGRFLTDPAPNR